MNDQKIELPPLPEWLGWPVTVSEMTASEVKEAMHDYARQAIALDRQQRGEPDYFTYVINGAHREISETLPPDDSYDAGTLEQLYLFAPQPAEPVVKESLTTAEPVTTQGEDELFYKLGCFIDHATGGRLSKLGWSLETLKQAHDENVQVIVDDALADERASRDAERGNVPSDDEIIATLYGSDFVPKVRALLARYGHMSTNPEKLCTSAERAQESAESIHEPTLEEEEAWQQMERRNE